MRRCLTPLSLIAVAAIAQFGRAQPAPPAVPAPQAQSQPMPPAVPPPAPESTSPFAPLTSAALGDTSVAMTAPGYLDPAAPMNVFRFRYDYENYINRPDRAEFFYAKSGLLGGRGVDELQSTLNTQVLTSYLEIAPHQQLLRLRRPSVSRRQGEGRHRRRPRRQRHRLRDQDGP